MTTLATASVAYGASVGTVVGTVIPSQAGDLDNLTLTSSVAGGAFTLNGDEITVKGAFVAQTYVLTINGTLDGSPMETIQVTVTITGHVFPVVSTTDTHDGLSRKELEALRKKIKAAERASSKRRAKTEQSLNDAIEAARVKLYGPEIPKPAPEPPKPVPVASTRPEAKGVSAEQLASLQASIAEALALIDRANEFQRIKTEQEQEEEDDLMILLAA